MSQFNAAMPVPVDSFDAKTREIVINYNLIDAISKKVVAKTSQDTKELIIEQTIEQLFELGHLTVRTVEAE